MADVLDIDNAEEFEVDEEGDRKYIHVLVWSYGIGLCGLQLASYHSYISGWCTSDI